MLKASGPQAGSPFSKGLPDRCPFCIKKSARLRDEERARLIWLLSTDKAVTSALLGELFSVYIADGYYFPLLALCLRLPARRPAHHSQKD
ncbi:hypothetical protein CKQ90_29105, partial [Klebsiella pneumoniae]